jgi:hypothetical protein
MSLFSAIRLGLRLGIVLILSGLVGPGSGQADEPPALNPFGKNKEIRSDAIPGFCELSDGTLHIGEVFLTRELRLKIYDQEIERQREIPLSAVRRIDAVIKKEWLEKEWRFRENANDEKVYTGRSYPTREYLHEVTLHDGRKVRGPLSAIIYLQPASGGEPVRLLLHKRDKGKVGTDLKSLTYVRSVELGEAAVASARERQQSK